MVSAGIVFENCSNCSVTGGSVTGFGAGVIATNTRGLQVNGMTFETSVGIDAEDCSNLHLSNNSHTVPMLISSSPVRSKNTHGWPQTSSTMDYALSYLKCTDFDPFS